MSEILNEARVVLSELSALHEEGWCACQSSTLPARVQAALGNLVDALSRPPADDVSNAVEAERQRAAAHAREGYRGNETCDDITKRILSGEPAGDEIPGRIWGPPAGDVREAARTFAESVGWVWESLAPMWQERFEQAARAVLVRPHGTVTDTETPEHMAERYVSAFVGDRADDSSSIVYRGPLLEMVTNAVREARS